MLGQNVLVLNRLWQAVHITTVRRAFVLLYADRAKALDEEFGTHDWDDWQALSDGGNGNGTPYIHCVNTRLLLPRVIQLLHFDRVPRSRVKFTRANIYLRDRYRCQYCGYKGSRAELNIDHLVPRSRGGGSTWDNVVVACIPCNRRKGDRLPEEAGMQPRRQPRRPRWHPGLNASSHGEPHPQWRPFLEASAWPSSSG